MPITTMKHEPINYSECSREGKRQIVRFIRRMYEGANIRDIIKGEHRALIKDGFLIGVITKL